MKLNKIAFFVEFGYIHNKQKELSKAEYAGINYGPVINNDTKILTEMEKEGIIKINGNLITPLKIPDIQIPSYVKAIIDPLIKKYNSLDLNELVALAHSTDSYKISTNNEKTMGKKIDKKLANLETFFEEDINENVEIKEDTLPEYDKKTLVEYAIK